MPPLPTGTVTFLFTDIEGSTQLWERQPTAMRHALARHNEILVDAITAHGGVVFKTVGDAFCAAFDTARGAMVAAQRAQRALTREPWQEDCVIRVRMALHTGNVEEQDGDYVGPPVNRVARLLSTGHGGQTLVSQSTQELAQPGMPAEMSLLDLGETRLKDLVRPEHIYQMVTAGLPEDFGPIKSLEYRPTNLPIQPTPFMGRASDLQAITQLLHKNDVRLLTLTGPGGTGKTRLVCSARWITSGHRTRCNSHPTLLAGCITCPALQSPADPHWRGTRPAPSPTNASQHDRLELQPAR